MDKPEIDKLLEAAGEVDRDALNELYTGWCEKFEAYRSAKSKASLAEWQAAEKALRAKADELTAKYFDAPGTRVLADRVEAWKFLQAEGYKVGRQTVYNAARDGKLIVAADGTITESDALAYAAKNLKKIAGKNCKADKVADERASEELALIRSKRARMDFEYDRERGKYLLKTDVRAEIAIKLAALEGGFKHMLRTYAADWIHRVGGDAGKVQMFLDLAYTECDHLFNEFGHMDGIGVIVVKSGGEDLSAIDEELEGGIFALDAPEQPKEAADGIDGDA
jgi:hypothetical protein